MELMRKFLRGLVVSVQCIVPLILMKSVFFCAPVVIICNRHKGLLR